MKQLLASIIFILSFSTGFCQSFMHGVGLTVIASTKGRGGSGDLGFGEGFTYSPRINIIENDKFSVSAGIPLSIGLSISTSTTYDIYGSYDNTSIGLIVNAPLICNLNMGRGSTKTNRQKFGYFVGAGFGYHHGDFVSDIYDPVTQTYTDSYSVNAFGPAANAGVRLGVGKKHKNIEIKLSYMKALNETKPNFFGLAGLFNF